MSYIYYNNAEDISYTMMLKLISFSHSSKQNINIALSGGNTPHNIFNFILNNNKHFDIQWNNLHFWWCDERYVPYENKENNFGEACRSLFNYININKNNLHPINYDSSLDTSVINYSNEIKKKISHHNNNDIPIFDWIWLGMGEDGHTASLFNNHYNLDNKQLVIPSKHPISNQKRISLTHTIINTAKNIDILIIGPSKKNTLNKVFFNTNHEFPIQLIKQNNNKVIWHSDQYIINN